MRDTHRNKNYSDNIDNNHLDAPRKRTKRKLNNLREPSHTRQMAQKILTRSQLSQSAPPGIRRKLIGTCIKEEDKKPKIEQVEKREEEFYQEELAKLQQRKKNINTKNKWPVDAKLVHIDGSQCSKECMQTSRYHMDPSELHPEPSTTTVNEDPRNVRQMGKANRKDQDHTDENKAIIPNGKDISADKNTSGTETNASAYVEELDRATNETRQDKSMPVQEAEDAELDIATQRSTHENTHDKSMDLPPNDSDENEQDCTTSKSTSDELDTNIAKNKKYYGTKNMSKENF